MSERIGIFIVKWHVDAQSVNTALLLAENGYKVDVFLHQSITDFYSFPEHDNIKVYHQVVEEELRIILPFLNYKSLDGTYRFQRIVKDKKKIVVFGTGNLSEKLEKHLNISPHYYIDNNTLKHGTKFFGKDIFPIHKVYQENKEDTIIIIASSFYNEMKVQLVNKGFREEEHFFDGRDLLDNYLLNKSYTYFQETIEANNYKCFIGFEKFGLIIAGMLGDTYNIPYIYFSLELLTEDNPWFLEYNLKNLREYERKYHSQSIGTIIQDLDRAQVLFKDNQVSMKNVIEVPVSALGEPLRTKGHFFKEYDSKFKVLYYGQIDSTRFCNEMIAEAQHFPENIQLIFHGWAMNKGYMEEARHLDRNGKVYFSTKLVDFTEIESIVSSVDIGLAFYRSSNLNEKLTGRSSEKIALYLRSGIPVITFNYLTFMKTIHEYRCGICISDFSQLKGAIIEIKTNYSEYQKNAFRCYKEVFEFSGQFQKAANLIDNL
ncbi:MAG TPA: glycosyltransferase family 4 protein [Bacillus bacterium]|nr:glycosyltransferase family 4 protein [Bacillus sp. (in: firmicutes)]